MGQKRELRKIKKILRRVRSCQSQMAQLSDDALRGMTDQLKERLSGGESLADLLPEAFAVVCEADERVLGIAPYDAQVIGAIALHQGYLAEMNTGEGKTLAATMPLYLNALTGKSTILMTANDYLAQRDAKEMGRVYRFLGLSVAAAVYSDQKETVTNADKKKIYAADIVYTTHGTYGFDYLFDHLATSAADRFQREPYYVIIDEADSVLLDAAQMPLVISGAPRVQSNLFETADFFVSTLSEGIDYEREEKKVWLTKKGIARAERFFQIDNFYGREFFEINRHVILALRAHALFCNGKEYMTSGSGELVLLDEGSGRMMPGVKLRGGQHQALEMKEKLKLTMENRSIASITYQNLFLLFEKMAGMSGTLADASEELLHVYGRKVLVIPPNRPVKRNDLPDSYYRDAHSQFASAVEEALRAHQLGRPVLITVTTIAETQLVSGMLMEEKVPHNVLNAVNAFWEADIIREAGQMYAVTVATSMAGRGTDIQLGPGVKELGGLAVIGIGRMANRRQERQARGRAGRQGDLGSSHFFVSLEDGVVAENGPPKLDAYLQGKKRMGKRKLKRVIRKAQALGEEFAALSRKQAVNYDQALKRQRELIYTVRNRLLDGGTIGMARIVEIAKDNIRHFLNSCEALDAHALNRYILDHISYRLDEEGKDIAKKSASELEAALLDKVKKGLKEQEERLEGRAYMNEFVRVAILNAIDGAWVEQVDYLQQLQAAVAGRAFAQRNLVFEYHKEALASFQEMERIIRENAIRNILLSSVYMDEKAKIHILFP